MENLNIDEVHLTINTNLNKTNSIEKKNDSIYYSIKSNFEYEIKNKTDSFNTGSYNLDDVSSVDSFDTILSDDLTLNIISLENEYKLLNEYLKNCDYDKVSEITKNIVIKEISIRKAENKKRINKLKELEDKLNFEKEEGKLNLFDNNDKKNKLVLANIIKEEGYHIVTENFIKENYNENKFCDYYYYTNKN